MRYRLLACTFSLACYLAALGGPAPLCSETSQRPTASAHSHEKPGSGDHAYSPMSWNQTFLAARIFLGRLPTTMPGSAADTPERIALGQKLFFERGISHNKTKACHDCHGLTGGRAGADVTPTSQGATGIFGKRNTPTVINAGFQSFQFWDGRAHNLAEQAKGPILNQVEMAIRTPEEVIEKLKHEKDFPEAFRRAFPGDPEPLTYDNLAEACAAFERTLIAPGRFDRLFDGDKNALNHQEKRGLGKFIQYRCVECHSWATVGGRLFHKLGKYHPYANQADPGRFEVTQKEADRFVFKVPSLRNVTRTPPYFHDGQILTLEEAIAQMGWLQLDRRLTPGDIADIIAFLSTLEGNPPPVEAPE